MSDFNVGDVCVFIKGGPSWMPLRSEFVGHEVSIVAIPAKAAWADCDVMDSSGLHGATFFSCLRKKPPPERQREDVGEWELCPWQPAKVTAKSEGSVGG